MEAHTKLWYLENFSLFDALTREEKEILEKSTVMRNIGRHEVLYFPSDASETIYMLKKGKVKISRVSDNGKEVSLAILGPGELFGELAITGPTDKREEIAEVTEDALICVININDIRDMMASNPKFNMAVLKFIGFKFKKIQSKLESLIFKTSDERVISFLKEIADVHGRKIIGAPNIREIKLGLTHAEIAKLTATSRQTVTTVLNSLERKGIITYDRKRINIKDYQALISF